MTDNAKPSGCPFHMGAASGRRGLLRSLAGGAALGTTLAAGAATAAVADLTQDLSGDTALAKKFAFYGPRQAGILNPPPAAGLVAAFDVLATNRAELKRLFQTLTERIAFLMAGGTPPEVDARFPPLDSGVLGPVITPDGLTVTVSLGASRFDARFGLQSQRPRHLETMRRFPNDALDSETCHGDVMLQICANTPEAVIHALRDVMKNTPGLLRLRWKLAGFLPTARNDTPRNMLGFKDGTSNLDTTDPAVMDHNVWIRPGQGEPAWAEGGSYQVVRIIRNLVERWDRTPLQEQESIMGRSKNSGAPLGLENETDDPNFADDPEGRRIRLDAHIRLANPRTDATSGSRILRRGFNYSRGVTKAGQLDMGLLFVCFQSNLRKGFLTVQERLNGEPLEEYIRPTGGGYFVVLPGVAAPGGYLGQRLVEAA